MTTTDTTPDGLTVDTAPDILARYANGIETYFVPVNVRDGEVRYWSANPSNPEEISRTRESGRGNRGWAVVHDGRIGDSGAMDPMIVRRIPRVTPPVTLETADEIIAREPDGVGSEFYFIPTAVRDDQVFYDLVGTRENPYTRNHDLARQRALRSYVLDGDVLRVVGSSEHTRTILERIPQNTNPPTEVPGVTLETAPELPPDLREPDGRLWIYSGMRNGEHRWINDGHPQATGDIEVDRVTFTRIATAPGSNTGLTRPTLEVAFTLTEVPRTPVSAPESPEPSDDTVQGLRARLEAAQAEHQAFRQRVYRQARVVQRRQGWCDAGFKEHVIDGLGLGDLDAPPVRRSTWALSFDVEGCQTDEEAEARVHRYLVDNVRSVDGIRLVSRYHQETEEAPS